jgi:hypothetical protein
MIIYNVQTTFYLVEKYRISQVPNVIIYIVIMYPYLNRRSVGLVCLIRVMDWGYIAATRLNQIR